MESQHIFFYKYVRLSLTLMTNDFDVFYIFSTYFLAIYYFICKVPSQIFHLFLNRLFLSFCYWLIGFFWVFLQTNLLLTYVLWIHSPDLWPSFNKFNFSNFCLMDSCCSFPRHGYCCHLSELINAWLNTCRGRDPL